MGRSVITRKEARRAKKLSFCYHCGGAFKPGDCLDDDHIPPRTAFQNKDRNWPLKLPVHEVCNSNLSASDEQFKHLGELLRDGQTNQPPHTKACESGAYTLLQGLPMKGMICRLVQACHAAFYQHWLPLETSNSCLSPLVQMDQSGHPAAENHYPQYEHFCDLRKFNARIGNVDRVETCNGQFRCHIVWAYTDDKKTPFAVFGIDICGWHKLSKGMLSRLQGCVGHYEMPIPRSPA